MESVFTPTQHARINFVPRDQIENRLVDALQTPGKQIVVYGHSGSGKSSLLNRKLEQLYPDHITTRCQRSTSFEAILLDAFDQLDKFYQSNKTYDDASERVVNLQAQYAALKLLIGHTTAANQQLTLQRVVPPQLTPQRLAQFMGARGLCWVIEDFHKVPMADKVHLSQCLKVFVDEGSSFDTVKIIAIGAVATAREVVEYDREMRTRVAEILVPLMSNAELASILANGEQLLRIRIDSWIKQEIVRYSAGLASVCHQLALNMCRAAGIERTCTALTPLSKVHFDEAVQRYIEESSDSLKAVFDKALRRKRAGRFDNIRLILTALAESSEDGLTGPQILAHIHQRHPEYPQGNLTTYLQLLQSDKFDQMMRCDRASGRYSFSDPLYHAYARATYAPHADHGVFDDALRSFLSHLVTTTTHSLVRRSTINLRGPSASDGERPARHPDTPPLPPAPPAS